MSKIKTRDISPVQSGLAETMEHTSSECVGRDEIILRSNTKITNHTDDSLGKMLEESDGAYIARKNILKFKRKIILTRRDKFTSSTFRE